MTVQQKNWEGAAGRDQVVAVGTEDRMVTAKPTDELEKYGEHLRARSRPWEQV